MNSTISISATTLSGGRAGHTCPPVALSFQVVRKVTDMKTCSVEGCNKKHSGLGYCSGHYKQIKNHGEIRPLRKHNNEIRIAGDHAEIVLYSIDGSEAGVAKVDRADVAAIKPYKWFYSAGTYVSAKIEGKRILLHRFLTGNTEEHIDHMNGDPSDNRRCNLRTATQSQNMMNRAAESGDLVGIRKSGNKWDVRIKADTREYYLGLYATLAEAMAARQAGERILFGEFSYKESRNDDHR